MLLEATGALRDAEAFLRQAVAGHKANGYATGAAQPFDETANHRLRDAIAWLIIVRLKAQLTFCTPGAATLCVVLCAASLCFTAHLSLISSFPSPFTPLETPF